MKQGKDNGQWYTGKTEDEATSFVYMNARYYDPEIARFISPDPVHFTEENPFSFNRYAYANNNPLKFVDPDGRDALVVIGAQRIDSPNFLGHAAMSVTGEGIYSFGTVTPLASSVSKYLEKQSEARNQYVFRIKATEKQDQEMREFLRTQKDDIGYFDNCATRSYITLKRAGFPVSNMSAPTPSALSQVLLGLVERGEATVVTIPIKGSVMDVNEFNRR